MTISLNYFFLAPELLVMGGGLLVLLADLYFWRDKNWQLATLSSVMLIAAGVLTLWLSGQNGTTAANMLIVDPLALFFKGVILISALLVVLLSVNYVDQLQTVSLGEYYALILWATAGAMYMAATADLVMIYIALELTSLASYVIAGYRKHDPKSNESILKYFLLGLLASAMMLYGFSFVYGFTGFTQLASISGALVKGPAVASSVNLAVMAGVIFALAAFCFKVASVPFHQWVPDVYEGAPTPITAFLSVVPKAAAFAALTRILFIGFPAFVHQWRLLFIILSIVSMFLGNLTALSQTNIKRMLGYSSIAHAGYIIMGFAIASTQAISGILIYVAVYIFMNIGAFAVVAALSHTENSDNIEDYNGLSKRSPFLALSMAIFMIALAGLPPTAGLWGKVYIFLAAVNKGLWWLALIGLVNTVISLYYYVNVIRHMYIMDAPTIEEIKTPPMFRSVIWLALAGTIILGVLPQQLIHLSQFIAKGFGIT